ncbi:hypothetical protein AVEN_18339-1 [Araneus ventricosus]|uniref:Uncharacterized protein n=1 Tax=Araneus ventricosus TaxID=182803 RepID=A0A4Y2H9N3_ARAVE|nr:hypothetical protein AVEN_18339-1 [Araneus ventricosus]
MNIIEDIRDALLHAVEKRSPPPRTPTDLWTALKDSWCELPPGYLETLIESMSRRVAALLRAVQQEHFPAYERNKTRLIQLLTQKMAAEGIETRAATGNADTYIVRCGLEKATSHPIVAITGTCHVTYCITNGAPLEEEELEFDQITEKYAEIYYEQV